MIATFKEFVQNHVNYVSVGSYISILWSLHTQYFTVIKVVGKTKNL